MKGEHMDKIHDPFKLGGHVAPADASSSRSQKKTRRLPQEIIALLGIVPDRRLARETGRAESTIRTARTARGIERAKSDKDFLPDRILSQLGNMPDAVLARTTGRSESTIRSARVRRGISRYSQAEAGAQKNLGKLPNEWLWLISCAPDALVAERLCISLSAVKTLRSELGMTELKVTQTLPPAFFISLGAQPDLPIAEKYSLSVSTIRRIRANLGIPNFCKLDSMLTDDVISLLGKVSDNELAKTSGLSRTSIRKARNSRNIPAFTGEDLNQTYLDSPKSCLNDNKLLPALDEVTMRLMAWCSDKHLADHLSIDKSHAIELRKQHGMVKLCMRKSPPLELFEDLGKKPDHTLAAQHGLGIGSIRTIRRNLGITAFRKSNPLLDDAVIERLGTMFDNELAQLTGLTEKIILKERGKRGIPCFSRYCGSIPELISSLTLSQKKVVELLRWAGNKEASEKLGISTFKAKQVREFLGVQSLNVKIKPPQSLFPMLGKKSDTEIAKRFKLPVHYVRSLRLKLNIKAFSTPDK